MTSLLSRDSVKGNLLDQVDELTRRLRRLEELSGVGGGMAGAAGGTGSSGGSATVAVSLNDILPGYLDWKIQADAPLVAIEQNDGGNEQLLLSIAPHLTPDAHHAPVTAGDGIGVSGQQVSVDSSVVRTSRTISAGNGLTGGGDLTANRSLALTRRAAYRPPRRMRR
jgi:hypothetical protein